MLAVSGRRGVGRGSGESEVEPGWPGKVRLVAVVAMVAVVGSYELGNHTRSFIEEDVVEYDQIATDATVLPDGLLWSANASVFRILQSTCSCVIAHRAATWENYSDVLTHKGRSAEPATPAVFVDVHACPTCILVRLVMASTLMFQHYAPLSPSSHWKSPSRDAAS
jgi:hypothetical protein